MWKPVIAVALGSSLGALLRWWLGLRFNSLLAFMPPGTLAANLIGGYVIGVALAFFAVSPAIAPEWRLFLITGICGGLTTFSTFSAEVVALLREERYAWALGAITTHVTGSLIMTLLGIASFGWLHGR